MFSGKIKSALIGLLLLLLISCGDGETTETVEMGPLRSESEEVVEFERAGAEERLVSPVAILVVDDFGPPPYHLLYEGVVASDVFEIQSVTGLRPDLASAELFKLPETASGVEVAEVEAEMGEPEAEFLLEQAPYQLLAPLAVGTCLSTPDGQAHYAASGLAHYAASGLAHYAASGLAEVLAGKPHGQLVHDQLQRSLAEGGARRVDFGLVGYDLFAEKPWLRDVELWEIGEGHILVAKLDTDGFSTELIAPRISDALAILQDEAQMAEINSHWNTGDVYVLPTRGAVVNMSFALIPCDLSFGRAVFDSELMSAYQAALQSPQLAEMNLTAVADQFNEVLAAPAEDAPLAQNELFYQLDSAPVLAQPVFREALINQAYGLNHLDMADFSRFLSECDEDTEEQIDPLCEVLNGFRSASIPVIPVAASGNHHKDFPFFPAAWASTVSIGATGADYSNLSEVTVDGSYELTVGDEVVTIGGTSFAAPRFSYLAALYLLRGGSATCTSDNGVTTTPPLGYASSDGPWEHRSLEEAVTTLCEQFPVTGEAFDQAPAPSAREGSYLERAMAGEFAGSSVELMGTMVDGEAAIMEEAVQPFEEATGIDVYYSGSQEFESQLEVRVEAGDPPHIANIPQPNVLKDLAADGYVVDVREFLSDDQLRQTYLQSWLDMATMDSPSGQIMGGVWYRAAPKSLVWYPKPWFDDYGYEEPRTWEELLVLTDKMAANGDSAWCIGIESGAATGWVATDWIENILLRTTSPDNYDRWVDGELPFASPEVQQAVEIMSSIWLNDDYVYGGTSSIVNTSFIDSPAPMFQDPPGCWLHLQGPFIRNFFPEGEEGVDYDFFYLPPIDEDYGRPVLVYGDLMAMFNDTPEARALMEFFSTSAGVEGWVRSGDAISPHLDSNLDWYDSDINRKMAQILLEADSIRFDASDLMPGAVGAGSFWTAMADYVSGYTDLETALNEIDSSWP